MRVDSHYHHSANHCPFLWKEKAKGLRTDPSKIKLNLASFKEFYINSVINRRGYFNKAIQTFKDGRNAPPHSLFNFSMNTDPLLHEFAKKRIKTNEKEALQIAELMESDDWKIELKIEIAEAMAATNKEEADQLFREACQNSEKRHLYHKAIDFCKIAKGWREINPEAANHLLLEAAKIAKDKALFSQPKNEIFCEAASVLANTNQKQAIEYSDRIEDDSLRLKALCAIAKETGKTDKVKANHLFLKALKIAETIDFPLGRTGAKSTIAKAMVEIDEKTANRLFSELLEEVEQAMIGNPNGWHQITYFLYIMAEEWEKINPEAVDSFLQKIYQMLLAKISGISDGDGQHLYSSVVDNCINLAQRWVKRKPEEADILIQKALNLLKKIEPSQRKILQLYQAAQGQLMTNPHAAAKTIEEMKAVNAQLQDSSRNWKGVFDLILADSYLAL